GAVPRRAPRRSGAAPAAQLPEERLLVDAPEREEEERIAREALLEDRVKRQEVAARRRALATRAALVDLARTRRQEGAARPGERLVDVLGEASGEEARSEARLLR